MSLRFNTVARTFQTLQKRASPSTAEVPEAVPWTFYDTITYVDATTTELTFFAVTQADRSLSNLDAGGSLPDPNFFEIQCVTLDAYAVAGGYVTTAAGGPAGAIDDIGRLVLSGRGRWTLNISDKRYGPFPLSMLHATGGATGFGWGTFTAEESLQYGNNGVFDGGYWFGGAITIPPKVGFNITLNWPAGVDITADYRLRVGLHGTLYRRIL